MVVWVLSTEPVLTEMKRWILVLSLMPCPLLGGGELAARQCPICLGETREGGEWAQGGWRGTLPLSTIGNQDGEIGPQHVPLEMTGLGRKYVKIIRKWAAEANGHLVLAFSGSFQFQLGCVFLDFIYMFLFLQPFLVFSSL